MSVPVDPGAEPTVASEGQEQAALASPSGPSPRSKPWERVLRDAWGPAALTFYSFMALGIAVFGFRHPADLEAIMMAADDRGARASQAAERTELLLHAVSGACVGLLPALWLLWRERKGGPRLPTYWAPLLIASMGLPLTSVLMFEYRHPTFMGIVLLAVALAAAHAVTGAARVHGFRLRDVSPRVAWYVVFASWLLFTAWMGGMSHWRFITFHAEPYDMSWETNAVHNIVHTGIPRISVGAGSFYSGKLLPANYADAHTPWIYYFYAPFYALFQDGRTLLWLQAALMGSGVFGTYLFARKWLRSHWLGALFAVGYAMYPNVQTFCLHDVHANYLAIPMVLWALGLMESGRPRLALLLAFLTCICREETAIYGAAAGLFWALGPARDVRRLRIGWITLVMSVAILLFITQVVMIKAGGKPRYSHFTFYYDGVGMGSVLKSYLVNPLGFVKLMSVGLRLEYVGLSLLSFGFLGLLGWRAAWFLLVPMGLLFPAFGSNFWVAMNYGAPVAIPTLLFSVLGTRTLLVPAWRRSRDSVSLRRMGIGAFLAVTIVGSGLLYGNIFGKTYKMEFGSIPFRQSNQYDYVGELGVLRYLPAYGERERLAWDLISRVPKDVPIATSWRFNPQLSNREVSLLYPEDGSRHPPENLARYIVIDRLTPMTFQPEEHEYNLRRDRRFRVFFENAAGVIFERK